jgi:alkylhydroperoxidase family enzyme
MQQAIEHGLEQGLVNDVAGWRESALFTERQRAALAWAEAVTEVSKTGVSEEVYAEVARHFSEKELVDLTLAIALMNAFARIAIAFRHGPPPMPALIEGAVQ